MGRMKSHFQEVEESNAHSEYERVMYENHLWFCVNTVVDAIERNDISKEDKERLVSALTKEDKHKDDNK
jgi:hypothetical protein